jgi:phospholipid transport system substrate-binding protein
VRLATGAGATSGMLKPMIDDPIVSPMPGIITASNAGVLFDHRTRLSDCPRPDGVPEHSSGVLVLVAVARVVTIALTMIAGMLAAPTFAGASEDPADFIRILGNQGLEVIRSSTTLDQKATYFHQMLRQDFDLTKISRFVLGPYWRVASKAQQREFRGLFENYLVRVYGQRFAQYGGESLGVKGSGSDPAGVTVTSQIIRPQGPPIEVDWRLVVSDGRYRISDVSIDGVSMALTQRSEFAAIIQRNGGTVAGLLTMMR